MKLIIMIISVCAVASAEYYSLPQDDYTPQTIGNDDEELKKRLDCVFDRQPCTPLLLEYKKISEDAIRIACAKCSPEFKALTKASLARIKEKYPADYRALIMKYDPGVTKFNEFEDAVGLVRTILSSLPLPSILSLPSLPLPQSIQSLPSIPLLQTKPQYL